MTMIPDVPIVHPRSEWEQVGYRMAVDFDRQPPAQQPGSINLGVAHYSSASNLPDGDPGETVDQIVEWLQRTQRDYLINRAGGRYVRVSDGRIFPGYPVGYLWAVDWLGGAWELRGFDYKSAANAGHNDHTAPIIFVTDGADAGTLAQWATARAIWREHRRRSGRADFAANAVGHGQLPGAATQCPGAGLLSQLAAGYGTLDQPTREETTMRLVAPGSRKRYDSRAHGPALPAGDHRIAGLAPRGAAGVVVNLTIVNPAAAGFAIAWGAGDRPGPDNPSSCINFAAGQVVANAITVPVDVDGSLQLFLSKSAHVICEVQATL